MAVALRPDETSVQLHEPTHDRQPETGATMTAMHRRFHLVERIPDTRQLVTLDPHARVLDRDPHLRLVHAAIDAHGPPGRRELHGVADEVDEDLMKPRGICEDRGQLARQLVADADLLGLGRHTHHRHHLLGGLVDVGGARLDLDASRLEP